jgi:hypothetical protein
MPTRIIDWDGTFFKGAKSDSDPGQIPMGYYWSAINMLNVGGTLSCRPGYKCIVTLPYGKLQGAALFRPKTGLEQIVVCIDGVVYVADWPFGNFRMLDNVRMSSTAKQVFWSLTEQSATRVTTDLASAITLIDPRAVLFIQDGGLTAPAWYDGSQSGHVRDNAFETPVGSAMAWVGDRLWVASGNYVYASDIADPFSFREQIYLGGVSAFVFKEEVTAMTVTPGIDSPQLLVFTPTTTSLVRANVRDRATWPDTEDFQREIFKVGCMSQRSVVNHFGRLTWMSSSGLVFFDATTSAQDVARMPTRDAEMHVSKTTLHSDLSLCAGGAFGPYVLLSVPAEDLYNKHTWVLNSASFQTLQDDSGPSWAGYWLGTRPVEWVYGVIFGEERIYHVSTDEDGQNRLWECFLSERLDSGCPITWAVMSRGYFGQTSGAEKLKGSDSTFCYADLALCGVEEDLDLAIFYAGGMRGAFKRVLSRKLSVERGCIQSGMEITINTTLFAYKPQSRLLRTEDARGQNIDEDTGSCPAERTLNEDHDESFQLLIAGQGPATIRWIRAWAQPEFEDTSGDSLACSDESKSNAVRFDGEGVASDSAALAYASLATRELIAFSATKTTSITTDGFTAVGVGVSHSIISQEAADRVASIIANKAAENGLSKLRAPIYSSGVV